MSSAGAPAGWYPDPGGGASLRWWDGGGWTDHLQSAPAPAWERPAGMPDASWPGAHHPGGGTADAGWQTDQPAWDQGGGQPGRGQGPGVQPGWDQGTGAQPGWGQGPGLQPGWGQGPGLQPGWGRGRPPLPGGPVPRFGYRGNRYSLIGFGVSALYLALAFATHFVLIGFIPLGMGLRARRAREPLAPIAIGVAVVVVLVSLTTLAH